MLMKRCFLSFFGRLDRDIYVSILDVVRVLLWRSRIEACELSVIYLGVRTVSSRAPYSDWS